MMANRKSDYYRIERSRETRLWLSQVVIPVGLGATYLAGNPQAREWLIQKKNNITDFVNRKILKKES